MAGAGGGLGVGAAFGIGHNSAKNKTYTDYLADLPYVQEALATELYGPGAAGAFGYNAPVDLKQGKFYSSADPTGIKYGGTGGPGGRGVGAGGPGGAGGAGSFGAGGAGGYGAGGISGNRAIEAGIAFENYYDMIQNPDLAPEEKTRVRSAAASPFLAEREALEGRASRTGNRAGLAAAGAELAYQKGATAADAESALASEKRRRKEAAVAAMQSMSAQDAALMMQLLGLRAGVATNVRSTYSRGNQVTRNASGSASMGG